MGKWVEAGLAVVAAALLSACAADGSARDRSQVYALGVAEVYKRLPDVDFPPMISGLRSRLGASIRAETIEGEGVTWTVAAKDITLMRIKAFVLPEGEARTRVRVLVEPVMDGFSGIYDARERQALESVRDTMSTPMFQEIYAISLQEAVGARLEGRAFDASRVKRDLAAYVSAHPEEKQALLERMEQDLRSARAADAASNREALAAASPDFDFLRENALTRSQSSYSGMSAQRAASAPAAGASAPTLDTGPTLDTSPR